MQIKQPQTIKIYNTRFVVAVIAGISILGLVGYKIICSIANT